MPSFSRDKPPSRDRWVAALGRTLILTSEGTRKYERRFGVPLSRILLAGWLRKGHLKRAGGSTPGRPSVVYEADLAYCAEVHAWRLAVGIPRTVPLLAKDGSPGEPAHKTPAEVAADYRKRKAKGISLRPRRPKKGKRAPRKAPTKPSKKP
ncbi:MAG: hypothetical protein JNL73_12670 [Anaerolineales bacterium]|nr:hypothetical protein [Anaerolineales bacterium]